jgi:hypothetical protein
METEFFTESTGWYLFGFIKIDNLPSLVGTVMPLPRDYLSSFFISCGMDIKCLTVLPVEEVFFLVGEDLPPS